MMDTSEKTSGQEPAQEPQIMSYDDVLRRLGEFGPYQRKIYFLLCIAVIPCSFHKLANVFLNATPDYRCQMPYESDNATFYQNDTIKYMTRTWQNSTLTCDRLDADFNDQYFQDGVPGNRTIPCDNFIFDTSKYKSSSVIEFLLICSRASLRATADALFMTGVMAGSYVFGDLSDRFGRRPTFIISLVLQLVAGILTAMAPEYISFVIGRILIGATTSGVFLVAYVIALEMVGPSKRLFAGVFVHMFFSLGFFLLAGIHYATADYSWRVFQVVITLLPGAFLMSYWWIIPESSRWLASRGRHKEAKEILMKVAKNNGVDLPASALDGLMSRETEEKPVEVVENGEVEEKPKQKIRQPDFFDLMRNPSLRKRSLNIFFNWFVNSLAYYGLSWSTSNLGGNDYINFCLSGLVEFPGYSVLLLTLNRFGRKFTLCGALLIGGSALLLTGCVPKEMNWLIITLAMIGKMAITSSYGCVYVFSSEQFPTVVRNVGLGVASMSARIGGILAPFINQLSDVWRPLPLIIYGSLAFCAGGLALLLPETHNRTLPETIEEGEAFVRNKKADLEGKS